MADPARVPGSTILYLDLDWPTLSCLLLDERRRVLARLTEPDVRALAQLLQLAEWQLEGVAGAQTHWPVSVDAEAGTIEYHGEQFSAVQSPNLRRLLTRAADCLASGAGEI